MRAPVLVSTDSFTKGSPLSISSPEVLNLAHFCSQKNLQVPTGKIHVWVWKVCLGCKEGYQLWSPHPSSSCVLQEAYVPQLSSLTGVPRGPWLSAAGRDHTAGPSSPHLWGYRMERESQIAGGGAGAEGRDEPQLAVGVRGTPLPQLRLSTCHLE